MSRLHKVIRFPLIYKFYICFFVFLIYGVYKNALLPIHHGFYSKNQFFILLFYPFYGFLIGALFDMMSKKKNVFGNKFYGLLFSMFLPISTPIFLFCLSLFFLLFINTVVISRMDLEWNFIAIGKILLCFILFYYFSYDYANALENSHTFIYSFMDGILGHTVSGIFTSNILLILLSFVFLSFDIYYKKEISFYSYGFYLLSLSLYAILKEDISFLLTHFLLSDVLFALIFVATLSCFSPYSKKRKFLYSTLLGLFILPCSLFLNFQEGVYVAILIANVFVLFIGFLQRIFYTNINKKD